eukprot:TRINITY_DN5919_c0_g2_i2.p1 TRINITY_DN5919_c0_g2~~TRINITY_DN5919_c0_g2_i2.p1  ORF type:complete len:135 (+),score=30.76 TRINITY_DN5919_c0_g2_i2:234-638(+)
MSSEMSRYVTVSAASDVLSEVYDALCAQIPLPETKDQEQTSSTTETTEPTEPTESTQTDGSSSSSSSSPSPSSVDFLQQQLRSFVGDKTGDFPVKTVSIGDFGKQDREDEELSEEIGRAVQQECRDRSRMPSSA